DVRARPIQWPLVSCNLGLPLSRCKRHSLSSHHRSRDEPTKAKYLLCPSSSRFLDGYRLANSLAPPPTIKCVVLDLTYITKVYRIHGVPTAKFVGSANSLGGAFRRLEHLRARTHLAGR